MAIVVPAYKGQFLQAALRSIASQTNQRFQLYVCDDGSTENLEEIFRSVFTEERTGRRFIRFDENWGARSLVQQWNRCVAQTDGEPWIWLFSDDDIAGENCVAAFYNVWQRDQELGEDPQIYRFNTALIDAHSACFYVSIPLPATETGLQFAYHRMLRQRNSFAPEHLFARSAFERCGGFVDFPFALGSDDASWIAFAEGDVLRTISGPYVYWRTSTENTSLLAGPNAVPKLLALLAFAQWLERRYAGQLLPVGEIASKIEMGQVIRGWFPYFLHHVARWLSWQEIERLATALDGKAGLTKRGVRLRLLGSNGRFLISGTVARLKRWLD